jgi:hypothetical protein
LPFPGLEPVPLVAGAWYRRFLGSVTADRRYAQADAQV